MALIVTLHSPTIAVGTEIRLMPPALLPSGNARQRNYEITNTSRYQHATQPLASSRNGREASLGNPALVALLEMNFAAAVSPGSATPAPA